MSLRPETADLAVVIVTHNSGDHIIASCSTRFRPLSKGSLPTWSSSTTTRPTARRTFSAT